MGQYYHSEASIILTSKLDEDITREKKNHRPISFMNRNIKILKKRKNTSKSKLAIYKKKESYTLAKSHPSGAKVVEYVKAN